MREQIAQHTYYGAFGKAIPQRDSATGEQQFQRRHDLPAASRHRVGYGEGVHSEDQPYLSDSIHHRMSPPLCADEEDEDRYPQRPRSSVVIRRHVTLDAPVSRSQAIPSGRAHRGSIHRVLFLGIGMLCSVILYITFNGLPSWWQHTQDDWHYGYPRTYQTDAVVGHEDSTAHPSHFIALNLRGRIEVIELPGGNPAKAIIYMGPTLFGAGQDEVPVTLTFSDVNGDGKPDMELTVAGSLVVFLNDGKMFQPSHS